MIAFFINGLRATLAMAAAMLPRRYWRSLEPRLPVAGAAFAASVLTLMSGAALGITGFLAHATQAASQNNRVYLDAAGRSDAETLPSPSALSSLSVFTFILLTPQGWVSSYLAISGLVRSIGSQFDDPHGDFLLTVTDAAARRAWTAVVRRGDIDNRHLLEGPRVRDRVVPGAALGLPHADLVLVASRMKDGWDQGTVVLTERGPFRLIGSEDRTMDGRLRRLYLLARHNDLEVFRRTVSYEFSEERLRSPADPPDPASVGRSRE